jgi:hypothetical protein
LQPGAEGVLAGGDFSLQQDQSARGRTSNALHWTVVVFLIGLAVPWIIPLGPLNLSTYGLVLLILLLPCLWHWVRGSLGGITVPDLGLFLYCIWSGIALFAAHGAAAVQTVGIFFIETLGAYLLARRFIRDAAGFTAMVSLMTRIVLVLSPFAIYEWLTGDKPLLWAFGTIFPTVEATMMPRNDFWRVQGPFTHSIEFGLFCTSVVALTHLAWGHNRSLASRWFMTGAMAGTALLSMSSAPLACLFLQVAVMGYNWLFSRFKSRWMILWSVVILGVLVVQFGSNLGAVKFFISNFTFDPQTGWYRIAIWDFGVESVLNHPLLGIGLDDWERPRWMHSSSVDNFWLLTAMRYGIPSVVLLFGSCVWTIISVARAKSTDRTIEICRLAYLICMMTFLLVGFTIHFAHAIYAWFMFALGSGVWLRDVEQPNEALIAPSTFFARDRLSSSWNARQPPPVWN